jgi:thioredoxin
MVKEVFSLSDFENELNSYKGLIVVDFFTTWCGPCKKIAPILEQLSHQYPEVKFLKVDTDKNPDIAAPRRISSIPTFHFVVNNRVLEEMKGANPQALEQKINQYKVNMDPFGGSAGHKLASDGSGGMKEDPREARLRALASFANTAPSLPPATKPSGASTTSSSQPSKPVSHDSKPSSSGSTADNTVFTKTQDASDLAAATKAVEDLEKQTKPLTVIPSTSSTTENGEELVPLPVDSELLCQLEEMGFEEVRGRKAIHFGKSLEGALGWLEEHQDDKDIDTPYLVKKSDTLPKPPMSEEEKQKKIEEMKEKIKQKREERTKKEKEEEIRREKERRERGQKMESTMEEREKMMRKIELDKKKKEKQVSLCPFCSFFLLLSHFYFDVVVYRLLIRKRKDFVPK